MLLTWRLSLISLHAVYLRNTTSSSTISSIRLTLSSKARQTSGMTCISHNVRHISTVKTLPEAQPFLTTGNFRRLLRYIHFPFERAAISRLCSCSPFSSPGRTTTLHYISLYSNLLDPLAIVEASATHTPPHTPVPATSYIHRHRCHSHARCFARA